MGLWDAVKGIMNIGDEYEEDEVETEEAAIEKPEREPQAAPVMREQAPRVSYGKRSKTVPFTNGDNMQLVLVKPERFEDVRDIADEYCAQKTIVLNLEKADRDLCRRIIDFMSGVAYAKRGKISKAANNTFVVTPCDVDVSGDNPLDNYEETSLY